jgi:hypothetical protein
MTVNNSDVMHRRTDGPSHWGSISLAREELLSAGKTLCGRELDASALACLVRPNPDQMTRLRYLHLQLGRAICFPPRILDAKSPRIGGPDASPGRKPITCHKRNQSRIASEILRMR